MKKISLTLLNVILFSSLIFFAKGQCTVDCMWPGDVNLDGTVNNLDFIYTGVAAGDIGLFRTVSEQGITWEAKNSPNWGITFGTSGIDFKHADANGDSWVDGTDLFDPQTSYYDTTNASYTGATLPQIFGNDLFLVFDKDSALAGDTITIGVHLGRATNPITNIHGIAFTVDFDTTKIFEALTEIDFHGGWLGTPFNDLLTTLYYKPNLDPTFADFGATRTTFGPVSGSGEIAQIIVVTEIDLAGKGNGLITAIEFGFENVIGLDSVGTNMMISYKSDSVEIVDELSTPVRNVSNTNYDFEVFPNPSKGSFKLNFKEEPNAIRITDVLGKNIAFDKSGQNITLKEERNGLYFIHANFGSLVLTEKIVIRK